MMLREPSARRCPSTLQNTCFLTLPIAEFENARSGGENKCCSWGQRCEVFPASVTMKPMVHFCRSHHLHHVRFEFFCNHRHVHQALWCGRDGCDCESFGYSYPVSLNLRDQFECLNHAMTQKPFSVGHVWCSPVAPTATSECLCAERTTPSRDPIPFAGDVSSSASKCTFGNPRNVLRC